jgi:hypothetical protein
VLPSLRAWTTSISSRKSGATSTTIFASCWRTEYLIALGFALPEAAFLAFSRVDIHELERLIARGCPPETAVRIAA